MSLTLTMKPLKGEAFKVEMDPEATVSDLKKKVGEMKAEFPAEQQKLIYSGKILKDEDALKTFDIKPDGFIVVMVTKAAATAPAPAVDSTAGAAVPASGAPAAAPGGAQPPAAGPALPQVILDLKNSPRFRELTMVVAQNPAVLAQMLPALRQQWPALLSAIQENVEGFARWLMQEAASSAMLANLANNPNVPPELAQAMQQNPQAIAALLQRAAADGSLPGMEGDDDEDDAPGGGVPVQMTPEDEAAIGRLAEMGFDKNMAAQAYFACEKNEELAANFLLSGGDDMQM